jgi:copper transport protein
MVAVGVLLGLLAILGVAAPAQAHAAVVRTDPPTGAIVPTPPAAVTVTFSESVRLVPGKIKIVGPDQQRADLAKPTVRGPLLAIPLRGGSPNGTYLVTYRVISADSHPVGGSFTFSIGAPSATAPGDTGAVDRIDPVVAVAMGVARYLGYAGLVLLVGPVLVLSTLWPRRLSRQAPTRLVWVGLGLVGAGTILELYLQGPYGSGTGLFGITGDQFNEVLGSRFGAMHLIRLAALAAAAVVLRPVLAGRGSTVGDRQSGVGGAGAGQPSRVDRVLISVLGIVALATWPISGHPGASSAPTLSVIADLAHLSAMSVWLGGLVMLFGFLLRQANQRELRAILPVWSGWAMLAVSVLVLAGAAQALVEVPSVKALYSTTYGRVLIVKICLLAVVLVAAWYSRRLVRVWQPAADGEPSTADIPAGSGTATSVKVRQDTETVQFATAPKLRRAVLVELAIVSVVLVASSVLVQTTPAGVAAAGGKRASEPFAASVTTSLYVLDVSIDPATTGNNSIHLFAYTPTRGQLTVREWHATAALPSQGIEPIDITLLPVTFNHAVGEVSLPAPGEWQFRFTLRTTDIDEAIATQTVPVG